MKAVVLLTLVLAAFAPAAVAGADDAVLPPGLWQVRIFAPVLSPAMTNDEQVFQLCYSAGDSKNHVNPVLPQVQAKQCQVNFTDLGDLAFDASCADGDHRLRISQAEQGLWRGTYRFTAREGDLMLEPAVELKRIASTCSR